MNRPRATVVRHWTAVLLLAFAGALVLAQSQGLVHSLVHGQHSQRVSNTPGHVPQVSQAASAGLDHDHHDHHEAREPLAAHSGASWLLRLFVGHDDESICRLFDQSNHTEMLLLARAHVLPTLPPAPVLALRATPEPQLAPSPRRARGPPTTTS